MAARLGAERPSLEQLLQLRAFTRTFVALILHPVRFFAAYHALVAERAPSFRDINAERKNDRMLGPVKFAALAITLSNLLLPLSLTLGLRAGAVSREYVAFAEWADAQGHLGGPRFTGIGIVDDFIGDLLGLLMFYALGHLIALLSGQRIPARFATGYYFYWNAWNLLGALLGAAMILVGLAVPLYASGLPQLVGLLIQFAALFMFGVFPILYWPRWCSVSRGRTAVALFGGLGAWIAVIAVVGPLIVDLPSFG